MQQMRHFYFFAECTVVSLGAKKKNSPDGNMLRELPYVARRSDAHLRWSSLL